MASLENRSGNYRIVFRYNGKKYTHRLKTKDAKEARQCKARLEENLVLLERGRLELPADVDLPLFLLSDGKLNAAPAVKKSATLVELFDSYQAGLPTGAKETSTLRTENIHIEHLQRILKPTTLLPRINAETLQGYIDVRSSELGHRGRPVSHATIKKEIGTLATVWNNWGVPQGLISCAAPTASLIYRKTSTRPRFQTWEEVERQIARGGLSGQEIEDLWDSIFLTLPQVGELLKHVRKQARFPFLYPMFVFTAHTGARRSEMLRSRIDDFDFSARRVLIREKKRDRGRELTFRYVPMAAPLASAMQRWFDVHPGGQLTLCREPDTAISVQMAAHHFRWALEDSKWANLRGWHVFRHSFASNCAAKGIDQRLIDSWMGHQTEQMRERYRHLFPEQEQKAMAALFRP